MTYRSSLATQVSSGTTCNAVLPTGTTAGDTLIVFASVNAAETAINLPSGYTAIGSGQVLSGSSAYIAGYKVLTAADIGNTVPVTWTANSAKADVLLLAYPGTASVTGAVASESVSQGAHTTPTITTSALSTVLTACISKVSTGTTITASTGTVRITDTTGGGGSLIGGAADTDNVAAGSVGGTVWTVNAASAQAAMWTLSLVPAPPPAYNTNTLVKFTSKVTTPTVKVIPVATIVTGRASVIGVTQKVVTTSTVISARASTVFTPTQKISEQSTVIAAHGSTIGATRQVKSGDQFAVIKATGRVTTASSGKSSNQSSTLRARAVVSAVTVKSGPVVVVPTEFPALTLDGVNLTNEHWLVLNDTAVRSLPAVRNVDISLPGRAGSLPFVDEDFDSATWGIKLGVFGDSQVEMDTAMQALFGLIGQRNRMLSLLRWFDEEHVQQADVKVIGAATPQQVSPLSATVDVLFTIPGVFWRDISTPDWHINPQTNGIYQVDTLDGCTGPIYDAVLLINGPVVNPQITDMNSGQSVVWQGILGDGDQLRIDVGAWTATVGTAMDWDGLGSDATGRLLTLGAKSQATLLRLTSNLVGNDPTNRQVQIKTVGDSMTQNTRVAIRARRSFL